nr:ribonuclease H-like domain-containing protein [Tanacetum cinerariifolium]
VAKELEEQLEREDQRMSEQIARDAEVARIHVEEELQSMIDGLDRSNETVAKYLQEYQQFALELPLERRKELISDLVRLYEPDNEYQLWTDTQNFMHAPVEWKLYDTCRVHHVTSKDKEIFMLVEKDYTLRKGLALVMISYKLQVENYSQMENDLVLKIYKIANSPRQQGEKLDKKNEMKARGTLLMALPNKDQLKFHSYQDAKLVIEAIEKRYGGNKKSKKVQRTLLKQQYKNFAASRSETLDQTFDRFQKLISQLEIQGSSSMSQNPQNVAFVSSNSTNSTSSANSTSSTSSTNEADNTTYGVKEMDLRWEMAMLTIRARRFIKRRGSNLDINGQKVSFDRSKVECFNCYKTGHFTRECRASKNQEYRGREYGRKTVPVENLIENTLIAQDRIGGSDSEVDSCSKTCLKAYATLKVQYDSLSSDYKKSQFNLVSYKAEKEKDELKLTLEKNQISSKSLNTLLESQLSDKVKTGLGLKAASPVVENFVNSSKMIKNQENVKSRSDKEYHLVPTPYTENYIPPKPDLMCTDKQVESEYVDVVSNVSSSVVKTIESIDESIDVKNKGVEVEFEPKVEDKIVRPSIEKIKFVKPASENVEKVETPKQHKHYPRGNQRNQNNLMSQRLGSNFKMINKDCFICGSFEHLHYVCDQKVVRSVWNNTRRVNHKNFANKMTHPHPKRRFVPQAILTKSDKLKTAGTPVNTVRQVNTTDLKPIMNYSRQISNAFKRGYSQAIRPFNTYSAYKKTIFNKEAFPLVVKKFPLPEGTSDCLKKNATARRKVMPLPEDCTAVIIKKKLSVKDDGFLKISAPCPALYSSSNRKFEQWQFRMQQYLQHKHYALWEVIEFRESYEAPENNPSYQEDEKESSKAAVWKFRAEGSETLEQTFTRLQVIIGQLQFMGVEVEQDDLNQKGNDEVNTASVYTASSNVSTANANIATVSISQETTCAHIASQSGKKISIQGSDVARFDKSKVECFSCHKMGHFTRECRAPRNQERGKRDTYRHGSKAKEQTKSIDGNRWSGHRYKLGVDQLEGRLAEYREREVKYIEKIRTLEMYKESNLERIKTLTNEVETLKEEKDVVDGKLARLLKSSKDLENIIESQRSERSRKE